MTPRVGGPFEYIEAPERQRAALDGAIDAGDVGGAMSLVRSRYPSYSIDMLGGRASPDFDVPNHRRAVQDWDIQYLMRQFGPMDDSTRRRLWADLRGIALPEISDFRRQRVLADGAAVTDDGAGAQVKFPEESYFDVWNFQGMQVSVESGVKGRQVNIRGGGGGADCMFDYLVSPCFADLDAFAEGTTYFSLSGCDFLGYSTIGGAVTHFNAQDDPRVIYICGGTYSEAGVSLDGPDVRIIGAGMERTIFKPTSGTAIAGEVHDGIVEIQDLTIDLSTTNGIGITGTQSGFHQRITGVKFITGTSGKGIDPNPASGTHEVNYCWFVGSGTGINAASNEGGIEFKVTGCFFACVTGIALDNSAKVWITSNWFTGSGTAIRFGGTFGSSNGGVSVVTGNTFDTCTTAIADDGGTNGCNDITITGNIILNCTTGISMTGSLSHEGITIVGNTFATGTGSNIGIAGHATGLKAIILGNWFNGYTANNEIQNCGACECAHNKTDSGATLPDTGTGHLTGGLGISSFWPIVETPSALTISSGAVTVTANQYVYTIDTEASAASDDLDTISGLVANRLYLFKPANDARTVVFKHETGNLHIAHKNADLMCDDIEDMVIVWYDGTTVMVMGGGGGGGASLSDGAGIDVTGSNTINWLPAMAWAMA